MASTIADVMDAVETILGAVTGFYVNDAIADDMPTPAIFVQLPPIDPYHATFAHGKMEFDLDILVLTAKEVSRVGIKNLALLASPTGAQSIHLALEADKTLGGKVETCLLKGFRPLGLDEAAQLGFNGGVFTLGLAMGAS